MKLILLFLLLFTFYGYSMDLKSEPVQLQNLSVDLPVEKYTLKNGLTVLLLRDSTTPLVSYHTWYRVGSRNERIGITGSAHMLEHMMFKGAKKYSNKDFDRILHANGITNNAFTTYDITGFYESLPSDKLELIMDLERDRLSSLLLRPEDLISEKAVVAEERRWRVDNNPQSLLREQTMELMFPGHPYRWPVIGYMNEIQAYTVKPLREFYEKYYGPNNAVLVIAGDIDIEQTKKLVEKYYGDLPVRPLSPEPHFKVKPMTQKKTITLYKDVQVPSLMISYPSVADQHPDSYALEVLAQVLANGASSRLSKELVYNKQWATATGAYQWSLKDAGIWGVYVSLKPGAKDKQILGVLDREIFRIRHQLITNRELKRALNQFMASFVDGLTTVDSKARALASAEIVSGDYKTLFTDLEKYQKVSTQDVRRVAEKYLNPNGRVIAWLKPESLQNQNGKKGAKK
jgi:zinc protease